MAKGFGIRVERLLEHQSMWTGRVIFLSSFTLKKVIQDELTKLSWEHLSNNEDAQDFMKSLPGYSSRSTQPEKAEDQLEFTIMSLRHFFEEIDK